jgi:hypothetical protein
VWPKPQETTRPEMNPQNGAILAPTWLLALLRLAEPEGAVMLEKKSQGNTNDFWDGQLDSSGSSILQQLQSFFVPRLDLCLDRDLDDPKSPGLWSIARGESLSPWEIKKVDFTAASPGFQTGIFDTPTTKNSFRDLADRLKIETTDLYQLVYEVRESVIDGNRNSLGKGQSPLVVSFEEGGISRRGISEGGVRLRGNKPLFPQTFFEVKRQSLGGTVKVTVQD